MAPTAPKSRSRLCEDAEAGGRVRRCRDCRDAAAVDDEEGGASFSRSSVMTSLQWK